jgi:hypothetical protein
MSAIFSREGFKALRFTGLIAIAAVGVAFFLVAGSYWYWQAEKRNDVASSGSMQEARTRVAKARQERDDLRDSVRNFQSLTARGIFLSEQRLEWIETLNTLKARHRILDLRYDVSAQRPLRMSRSPTFSAVEVLGSRVIMKISARHDGDLLAFLDEFPRLNRGLFPIDRCNIKRVDEAARPTTGATGAQKEIVIGAQLVAECSLEWITLRDKYAKPLTLTVQSSQGNPR